MGPIPLGHRQRDGDELIIGRPDTGTFVAVSPEAVELLDRLAQGWSVGEVAAQAKSEVSDLDGFLSSQEIEGLVKPHSANEDSNTLPTMTPPVLRYHFSAFPQKLAQRIYSRPALAACFLLICLASVALIYDPSLWPRGLDLFFTSHKTIMLTILLIVSFGSVVIHESSHVIAARAQGVNSRLGLGNRLWAFVVEADLTGLWSIPRRQRYLPMMAGSLFDAVMSSGLILVLLAHNHALVVMSPITVQLLRAILLTYMTRIMWQTLLFVRTDYYYVIATFFNCRNLMGDTEDYLRNQLARFISRIRPVDQSTIPASERRVVMMYVFVWTRWRRSQPVFCGAIISKRHLCLNRSKFYWMNFVACRIFPITRIATPRSSFTKVIYSRVAFISPVAQARGRRNGRGSSQSPTNSRGILWASSTNDSIS